MDRTTQDRDDAPGPGSRLLANERTFLAQVRIGVAVMALGFVVAKLSLVLRELGRRRVAESSSGSGPLIGAGITALGALVVVSGAARCLHRRRATERGASVTSPALDLLLAVLLASGLGLAVLLIVRGRAG